MFEAYAGVRALPVRQAPYCPFPPASDRRAWEGAAARDRANLLTLYQQTREAPYPMCTASRFLAFTRTGSREAYETPYFFRRRKLIAAALHECLTGDGEAVDDVVDGVWCLCEETSWVISAHNVNAHPGARPASEQPLPDERSPYIDLFSAQTAMILSLTCALLGDRLDAVTPLIRRRVAREIEKRVLTPFETRDDFWWMGFIRADLCNWTPWIVSNVLVTAGIWLSDRDRLGTLAARALRMLDRWLAVVPPDGGCDEGVAYWNMAGGALLDCLEWLEPVCGLRFWEDEKLRAILRFPKLMHVGDGWFVNFADCDARPMLCGERLQTAGERIGDAELAALGAALRGTPSGQIADVPHMTRLLSRLFHPAAEAAQAASPGDAWLPDLQVRVARRGSWTLACKGGHNGESHNHNDVGSFVLYLDGKPLVIDVGNMTYTAKTFSPERYTLWNTRSANHNVPLVGTWEQVCGRERAASDVKPLPGGLSLSLEAAYPPEAGVRRMTRALTVDGAFAMRDEIALETAQPVTWVWMLYSRPELASDGAVLPGARLRFDPALTPRVEEIPVSDARMRQNYPGSVWRLTLTSRPGREHKQSFTIERTTIGE